MIENTIQFDVQKRNNAHTKKGVEWAFRVQIGNGNWWTITAFEEFPRDKLIASTKEIVLRSMEVYHHNLKIPSFKMEEIKK